MDSLTIRVSPSTQGTLRDLEDQTGESMTEIVDRAVREYQRRQFWANHDAAYAALQADPEARVSSRRGIRPQTVAWLMRRKIMASQVTPSRGDVVLVNLDPTIGHEQGGQRPALVASDDSMNRSPSGLVIVTPITRTDRGIPAHVMVSPPDGGPTKPSVIMADQIRAIPRMRIARRLGTLSPTTMGLVGQCIRLIMGL